jgi:hypothetical protein
MAKAAKKTEATSTGKPREAVSVKELKLTPPGLLPPTREEWNAKFKAVSSDRAEKALEAVKQARGRPSRYTEALADELLDLVANGVTVTQACAKLGLSRKTVETWLGNGKPEIEVFKARLARARNDGGEALAGEALQVARDTYAKEEVTSAQVQAATLLTNVLKWQAGVLNTSYNPNAIKHLEITGANGAPLNQPVIIDARSLPDDQREAVRQALLAMRGDSAKTIDG